jgi:hypothetical protein
MVEGVSEAETFWSWAIKADENARRVRQESVTLEALFRETEVHGG